jgi:multiple sugar transport system substrate-binding protein
VSKPYVTYVWADHFPNGWPETPEEFYVEAERLKNDGVYAMALFGSTAYDGTGAARGIWSIIASFGGTYSDNEGNMVLNTPENVAAIEFLRDITSKGYLSDTSFAGGFQEEESFKDASAASIPTGLFGYRYINPLIAPDGTKYEKGTYEDMLDAIADGKVIMSPMFAPDGMTPSCGIQADAYVLPTGAKNVEGAYALINWWMSNADIYAEYVIGPGAGFPVNNDYRDHPTFQEPFYKAAAEAIDKSECRSFIGTLTNPVEARTLVMNAIYKLIKEDPTADIPTELQKVQEEYNANN